MYFVAHLCLLILKLDRLLCGVEYVAIPLNKSSDGVVGPLAFFIGGCFFLEVFDDLLQLSYSILVEFLLGLEFVGGWTVQLFMHEFLNPKLSTYEIIYSILA